MTLAPLKVEVAFASDPGSSNPTWVDVSSRVLSCQTQRGRQYELDTIQAGTATIRFDNADRRFDPTYTSSPYYPNVLPMRPIRVSTVWAGTTYYLFNGFVEKWPIQWEAPVWGSVTVTCTDLFASLSSAPCIATPNLFSNGGFEAGTSGWTVANGTLSTVTTGQQNGLAAGKMNLHASVSPSSAYPGAGPGSLNNGMVVGHQYRCSCWVLMPSGLGMSAANTTFNYHYVSGIWGTVSEGYGLGSLPFDTWFPFVLEVWVPPDATAAWFEVQVADTGAAKYLLIDSVHVEEVTPVTISNPSVMTQAGPFSIDGAQTRTGYRINEALNTMLWPQNRRQVDAGNTTVQATTVAVTDGQSVLSQIQLMSDAEQGEFFVNGAGVAVFRQRDRRFGATSRVTFTDAGGGIPYLDQGLTPDYTVDKILNEVTVTRSGGTAQTSFDAASQTHYLRRTNSLTPPLISDSDANNLADFLVSTHKDPQLRFDQLQVRPQASDAVWPWALGLELGDKITVVRTPQGGSVAQTITVPCFVEQVQHQMTPDLWETTFALSPSVLYDHYFTLGSAVLNDGNSAVLAY